MALSIGARLGPYEVLGAIGAGGMGEIYKARDTRLDRMVALKVLPAHVVDDPVVRLRFERESKTIAALNHPHICTLYDVGRQRLRPARGASPRPFDVAQGRPELVEGRDAEREASGGGVPASPEEEVDIDFLVLELIEGESLADRLKKGPLPLDQALRYGSQVADALDRAHRQGIVHRDLKPGNIMLTKAGAKLLDFGLAKQAAPVASAFGGLTTHTAGVITAEGTIVGTCQYMAPEQLEGHEADSRSDIWAFGALLYEMVTGKTAFEGKSYASLIGAILHRDPEPMSKLQPLAPPLLEHIVHTCLAKDPDDRWQSMADVRRELSWSSESGGHVKPHLTPGPAQSATRRRELIAWAVAALMTTAAVAGTWFGMSRSETGQVRPPVRFTVALPDSSSPFRFSIVSPDGRQLAFLANAPAGATQTLWVRSMNGLDDARSLAGTEGAFLPFWSADSRSVGFFSAGKLRWSDLANVVQTICDAPEGRGGTWNHDNTILFAPDRQTPLFRVAATAGATPVRLTQLGTAPTEISHRLPSFLPDGQHFVLTALGDKGGNSIKFGSLDSPATTELVARVTTQAFVSGGFLLFGRDGPIFAQPFDQKSLRPAGDTVIAVSSVELDSYGWAAFSVSDAGLLVFRPPAPLPMTQLRWFTRAGAPAKSVGEPGKFQDWSLSPDGRRLAFVLNVSRRVNERTTVWVMDLERGTTIPLKGLPDTCCVGWSADSTRLVVSAQRGLGTSELYLLPADGTRAAERVAASPPDSFPQSWSPDGKFLLFRTLDLTQGGVHWSLLTTPMPGQALATLFAKDASAAKFSPDGLWVAYTSAESDRPEVFVQAFPSGPRVPVTSRGGDSPSWTGDGSEILYHSQDKIMAVAVKRSAGPRIEIGTARALFDQPPGSGYWELARDGQRILIQVPFGPKPAQLPLTVVVNWTEGLKK